MASSEQRITVYLIRPGPARPFYQLQWGDPARLNARGRPRLRTRNTTTNDLREAEKMRADLE